MDEFGPYIALIVLGVVLKAANARWPKRRKRVDRKLASRPRALVRDAQGTVRLTGRTRPVAKLLHAPLSGWRCLAYEVVVYQPSDFPGPDAAGAWTRVVDLRAANPFFVADESGEARVDTSGPFLVSLSYNHGGQTGWFTPYPGKHHGLVSLLVSGVTALDADRTGERKGPRSPPERLVLRGTKAVPLLISDEPGPISEP